MSKKHTESLDNLVQEHERLVGVLKSPSHKDDKRESKVQEKELEEYKHEKSAFWNGFEKRAFDVQSYDYDEKANRFISRVGRTNRWGGPNHFIKELKGHHAKGFKPHYSFDGQSYDYDPKDHKTHAERIQSETKRGKRAYMGHTENLDPKQELEAAKHVKGKHEEKHKIRNFFFGHAGDKRLKELQKSAGAPPLVKRLLQKANLKGYSRKGLGNTRLMKELRRLGL